MAMRYTFYLCVDGRTRNGSLSMVPGRVYYVSANCDNPVEWFKRYASPGLHYLCHETGFGPPTMASHAAVLERACAIMGLSPQELREFMEYAAVQDDAVVMQPERPSAGPRKPKPAIPPEVHNTAVPSGDKCMDAVRAMCKGS